MKRRPYVFSRLSHHNPAMCPPNNNPWAINCPIRFPENNPYSNEWLGYASNGIHMMTLRRKLKNWPKPLYCIQ